MDKKKIISLVVSVYNEEAALERFYAVTKKVLDGLSWDYEILLSMMAVSIVAGRLLIKLRRRTKRSEPFIFQEILGMRQQ